MTQSKKKKATPKSNVDTYRKQLDETMRTLNDLRGKMQLLEQQALRLQGAVQALEELEAKE